MFHFIESGDSFFLQSGKTSILVLTPWSRQYGRTRFNHSALIARVWIDEKCFTQKEKDQGSKKSSDGEGLFSEYKTMDIEQSTSIGEKWLKPGIGVLERLPQEWNRFDERRTNGLPITIRAGGDAADFLCISPIIGGYAYSENRTIELKDCILKMHIVLNNTGEKTLHLLDYCHNFVFLPSKLVGPDYRLWLPCLKGTEEYSDSNLSIHNSSICWNAHPQQTFFRIFQDLKNSVPAWRLYDNESGSAIQETVDFVPEHVAVWVPDYCACTEVFHEILLRPGEKAEWTREWMFQL